MNALAGTVTLTRLALRRDRITLMAWLLGLAGLMAMFAAMSVASLPTQQDVIAETRLMAGAAPMRMLGLPSGATVGGYALLRSQLTLAILAALMTTLTVVRHTRQNEETGRAELVGAAAVGRHAGLAAAAIVGVGASVVLSLLFAAALIANGQPAPGSLVGGISMGAVALVFVAVAAVATQLSSSGRAANGIAAAVLGMAFLLSGVGNMLGRVDATGLRVVAAWPSWLSPIGWAQQMRPYGGNHVWPLALFAATFVVLLAVAAMLATRRDLGRGVLPARRGRAAARASLLRPYGLAARLQRGTLIGWAAGMLGFGLILGASSGQMVAVQGSAADWYARMGGTDVIVDAFRTSMMAMAGMGAAIYVVQVLLRMRAEEAGGQAESVLATAVSRPRLAMAYVANALLGATGLVMLFAVSLGLTAGQALGGTAGQLRATVEAGLLQIPAIMVVGACVVALSGLTPRWAAPVSWIALAASIFTGPLFGPALNLPQWACDLGPFTHVHGLPAGGGAAAPIALLTATAAALVGTGLISLRRRDLALPT